MFISIRAKIFLVLSICLVLAATFIYAQTDRRHINNNSVVLISSVGCRSAETRTVGTIIDGGFVLTVAHGVAGQNANRIIFADGVTTQASIAAIDSNLDLALLKFDAAPLRSPVKPIKFASAKPGETVLFIAFNDQTQFARDAKIKRRLKVNTQDIYLREKTTRPGLEVELDVEVGNSGGPLLNKSGELVGIVWSTSRIVKNRSWATRSEAVTKLLASVSTNAISPDAKPLACTG